jgi:surface antigen
MSKKLDLYMLHRSRTFTLSIYPRVASLSSLSLLLMSSILAICVSFSSVASADTLGYPWPTDTEAPCEFGSNGGASCVNPNNSNDLYDWGVNSGGTFHQYRNGYEYRNCTDYVQWEESTPNINVSVPTNWGNGGQWYDNAPSNEKSTTPKAWDAAVVEGNPGHVAFVQTVNQNGTITVAEYNHDTQGHGDTRTATASSMGFTEFVDFGVHPTQTSSLRTHKDLAWYDGSTLWGFQGTGYGTSSQQTYSAPGWAGAGQYGSDSKEGVFWYDANSTSIYYINSNWTSQLVRGPGIGAPVWAGVGNFTGDGKRDSIAWYDGTNLYLFKGTGLATSATISGYSTPTWAGVGDYNKDGKDDLFWYLGSSTTIYALTSTGSTFNGAASVRGPGLGAPTWAGVGDFHGDGYRDALAWYDGSTLWTFEGASLNTSGSVTGYSSPTWAGVGQWDSTTTKDGLFWYIGGTTKTLYGISSNGSAFMTSPPTLRSGIGAPTWADSGNFY